MKQRQLKFDFWAGGSCLAKSGPDAKRAQLYRMSVLTGSSGQDSTGVLWQTLSGKRTMCVH